MSKKLKWVWLSKNLWLRPRMKLVLYKFVKIWKRSVKKIFAIMNKAFKRVILVGELCDFHVIFTCTNNTLLKYLFCLINLTFRSVLVWEELQSIWNKVRKWRNHIQCLRRIHFSSKLPPRPAHDSQFWMQMVYVRSEFAAQYSPWIQDNWIMEDCAKAFVSQNSCQILNIFPEINLTFLNMLRHGVMINALKISISN